MKIEVLENFKTWKNSLMDLENHLKEWDAQVQSWSDAELFLDEMIQMDDSKKYPRQSIVHEEAFDIIIEEMSETTNIVSPFEVPTIVQYSPLRKR